MSNLPADNFIYGTGGTLINDTANTIQGAGVIGDGYTLTINNKGTINANVSNSLTINPSNTVAVTNSGLLEATAGGTLLIPATVNNSGTILSTGSGSVVNLASGTVNGGTLTTTSGGTMYVGGSTLSGVTISTGTTATVENGTQVTLAGTITNNGTLALASTGANTLMQISGTVSNTGGGLITLSNRNSDNFIYGTGGTLINDTTNTIQGAGVIGDGWHLTVNNKGTIDANVTNSLTINPAVAVTNTGLLEATSGGTLLIPATVNNTGGTIRSTGAGSVVNLANGTDQRWHAHDDQRRGHVCRDQHAQRRDHQHRQHGHRREWHPVTLAGTITNNGTIALNPPAHNTCIQISGTVSNTGGGLITMSNHEQRQLHLRHRRHIDQRHRRTRSRAPVSSATATP